MSASATTPNLKLPQYSAEDKPTYLVDTNGAYAAIDDAMGKVTALSNSNEQKITNLQTAQGADRTDITTMQGDINLIKTNQTAVNQHLTDVDAKNSQQDTEISSLDNRITALEDVGTTPENVYTKTECDAKFATAVDLTAANATIQENTSSLTALETRLSDKEIPFKFGVDDSGNYGYYKAGADTVTPFKADNMPDSFDFIVRFHLGGDGAPENRGRAVAYMVTPGETTIGNTVYTYTMTPTEPGATITYGQIGADIEVTCHFEKKVIEEGV